MLKRELGLWGATLTGLGSMIGTGLFVSLGIATDLAGPWVLIALILAAAIALCNGLSSAQLAASHPVSGGTYEYGYRYLSPPFGFTAGWMFLLAKSASAATAALGSMAYLFQWLGLEDNSGRWQIMAALGLLAVLICVVLLGIRRSAQVNLGILLVTFTSLLLFVGIGHVQQQGGLLWSAASQPLSLKNLLQATALLFVAYAGYARIAVLAEEVKTPRRTIPRAIALAIGIVVLLYFSVALIVLGSHGSGKLTTAASLEIVASELGVSWLPPLITLGAIAAMVGILLNLLLGLSRVVLAMARRRDLPAILAQIPAQGKQPVAAVLAVSGGIALLILIGNVKTTWSFSAFSVLIYYAITNLATLQLKEPQFPRWLAVAGLIGCLGLAFWVEVQVWLSGCGLILLGLAWHYWVRRAKAV
ncbi:APC family permease [Thermosynechococcus sp. JY1334]|uniref:APC family permease n=1 Tax=unclassified Thermosynechococcus TaxID=2622553 RepID=UPI0026723E3E|nr:MULTISPECIES: APC family permease [unclassified Thermosynechococcus]MDR7899111.1 APC family permease [Thermosynechococcus sp. JY1332]MDR7906518.1 APC family permease [Thermosynechococcus sp. JY1334]MDR7994336.1 APC family permease [Thermosynechococcus sp. TG252]WKT86234.1 APC family permease [Thermosynechococcus sp. JY1339]WNC55179.1 APC family permease [Thermosynechococcus sp. JY1331]